MRYSIAPNERIPQPTECGLETWQKFGYTETRGSHSAADMTSIEKTVREGREAYDCDCGYWSCG